MRSQSDLQKSPSVKSEPPKESGAALLESVLDFDEMESQKSETDLDTQPETGIKKEKDDYYHINAFALVKRKYGIYLDHLSELSVDELLMISEMLSDINSRVLKTARAKRKQEKQQQRQQSQKPQTKTGKKTYSTGKKTDN